METIKTDESQNVKKTVGYYRERLKSLNPKEKEYRQEKKAYELSSADFLKRYTKEFLIDLNCVMMRKCVMVNVLEAMVVSAVITVTKHDF